MPETNYVKKDGERIEFSCSGKHAIEHALNFYGIKNGIDLKCEIYLTEEEKFNSNLIKNLQSVPVKLQLIVFVIIM